MVPPSSSISEAERAQRLAAAIDLVASGGPRGKVSVRRAALIYGVSKSTLHRHITNIRASRRPRAARASATPPRKCGINFIVHQDDSFDCTSANRPVHPELNGQHHPLCTTPSFVPH